MLGGSVASIGLVVVPLGGEHGGESFVKGSYWLPWPDRMWQRALGVRRPHVQFLLSVVHMHAS